MWIVLWLAASPFFGLLIGALLHFGRPEGVRHDARR